MRAFFIWFQTFKWKAILAGVSLLAAGVAITSQDQTVGGIHTEACPIWQDCDVTCTTQTCFLDDGSALTGCSGKHTVCTDGTETECVFNTTSSYKYCPQCGSGGRQACYSDGTFGPCQPTTARAEDCNGCDDDKDGCVDEGPYTGGGSSSLAPGEDEEALVSRDGSLQASDYSCFEALIKTCGSGDCSGIITCNGGQWSTCSTQNATRSCTTQCNTPGTLYCNSSSLPGACTAPEQCNGCDDDGDGHRDNAPGGADYTLTRSTPNPNGCQAGTETCIAANTWSTATPCSGSVSCVDSASGQTGTAACTPTCGLDSCQLPATCNPTPATMTFTAQGPQTWPAACFRPFEVPGNPFYREIPATARTNQLRSGYQDVVTHLLTTWTHGELQGRLDGMSGEPTYYSQASDPEYTIHCANDPYEIPSQPICPAVEGMTIHIPSWAKPEGGLPDPGAAASATNPRRDAHISIVDQANGVEWDFWQVQTSPLPSSPNPDGSKPQIVASFVNRIDLTGDGLYPYGVRGATAAGYANRLGRIRLEELQAGEINHALFMYIPCHNLTEGPARGQPSTDPADFFGVVYPASAKGRQCADSTEASVAPAMGAHFFYDRTPTQIDALNIQPWKKTLLKALSRYGAFVGDTAGFWGFEQESSYQYSSVTDGEKRWYNFGAANNWNQWYGDSSDPGDRYFGKLFEKNADGSLTAETQEINFAAYLKILNPCVSQGQCT